MMNRAAGSLLVSITIALAAALLAAPWCRAADSAEAALFARSIVSAGDTARLQRAFAKARRGQPVTVAVMGGSITQGAKASKTEFQYGSRVADWWRRTFPETKITFVNAGIGATGSNYGALRARRDLLSRNPDFVVVEYAVNDAGDPTGRAESLEGLVRQILSQPNQPAVMLLFTMSTNGRNVQEWHSRVGRHYELPMASFRDALWPEIEAGRMQWSDIEADDVHPNDRGHDYCARFVTRILDTALRDGAKTQESIGPLPTPLFNDLFEHVTLFEGDRLKPVNNQGWTFDAKTRGFTADQPGSVIEFEIEGRAILVTDWHIRGPFGKAKMQVDDLPPVIRDAWYEQTWGGYRDTSFLARDLNPGKHRVRIELLEDKNPQSDGHQFRTNGPRRRRRCWAGEMNKHPYQSMLVAAIAAATTSLFAAAPRPSRQPPTSRSLTRASRMRRRSGTSPPRTGQSWCTCSMTTSAPRQIAPPAICMSCSAPHPAPS